MAERQRAKNLKERYGGEWAVINEGSDQITHQLALELSREGYNLIFIVSKEGPEKRVATSSPRYKVQVEFITAENYLTPG